MSHRACVALGLAPSFGFGDRLGLATPGHIDAMKEAGRGMLPIFPQQSIREMTRTGRSPIDVMRDAMSAVESCGWSGPVGADADHLKTREDVDRTAAAGFTFFTIDPSGVVDRTADHDSPQVLNEKFRKIADQSGWIAAYRGRRVVLPTGPVLEFDDTTLQRAAVKYGAAIAFTLDLANYIRDVQARSKRPYEIELSVDETDEPTSLAEHYLIADQLLQKGVKLVSLAPRFPGDFEKGVDFKGDREACLDSLKNHAAIARLLGPYKISLHSGSDKLSIYAGLASATRGVFHVKTAGTSYLEALRVIALEEPKEFRELVTFSRSHYDVDKATYHVSATLENVPEPQELNDATLRKIYLQDWQDVPPGYGFTAPGRQILHCTFGSVLTDPHWGAVVKGMMRDYAGRYREVLRDHFIRHLDALQQGFPAVGS